MICYPLKFGSYEEIIAATVQKLVTACLLIMVGELTSNWVEKGAQNQLIMYRVFSMSHKTPCHDEETDLKLCSMELSTDNYQRVKDCFDS